MIFATKTLSDPGACGVTNRRGIRHSHQIVKSNEAQTDQLHGAAVLRAATMMSRGHPGLSSIPPGSVVAACSADYACSIFPTKTLSDPSARGVTNRRGI